MKITSTVCDCCDVRTYHCEIDKESLSIDDGQVYYHLTLEEMEDIYHSFREVLIHGEQQVCC